VDLPLYSLNDLEEIASEKGGIPQRLDEQWRKVYKASATRGLFKQDELRVAYAS